MCYPSHDGVVGREENSDRKALCIICITMRERVFYYRGLCIFFLPQNFHELVPSSLWVMTYYITIYTFLPILFFLFYRHITIFSPSQCLVQFMLHMRERERKNEKENDWTNKCTPFYLRSSPSHGVICLPSIYLILVLWQWCVVQTDCHSSFKDVLVLC